MSDTDSTAMGTLRVGSAFWLPFFIGGQDARDGFRHDAESAHLYEPIGERNASRGSNLIFGFQMISEIGTAAIWLPFFVGGQDVRHAFRHDAESSHLYEPIGELERNANSERA